MLLLLNTVLCMSYADIEGHVDSSAEKQMSFSESNITISE